MPNRPAPARTDRSVEPAVERVVESEFESRSTAPPTLRLERRSTAAQAARHTRLRQGARELASAGSHANVPERQRG
jgi:hypothetical protein